MQRVSVLQHLTAALSEGSVEVVDLTAPLSEETPVIQLPADLGQPWPFRRETISHYDQAGPEVYWSNIRLSEHTGTHFDAPVHWLPGRDLDDVAAVPPGRLVGPAAVLDVSEQAAADPDFLLTRADVEAWEARHGPLPDHGWMLLRTGWDARGGDRERFLNGGHTPGIAVDCARWLAKETSLLGVGVETVGTDAGQAAEFEQPFPCHWYFQGAGKYGLTQLRNLHRLPPRGAVLIAGPLPIVRGSGSPARVLALVERDPQAVDRGADGGPGAGQER
ncbi:cyclase family protein [Streptomyces sp. NPDC059063]|uniref:cyclase family protein n=1 Tax=unclassified Streptomyces TaxID=2593676 RepID=UPI0036B7B40F